ncbi:helix-turn-helix transcriptional regulator [Clostridium sp.]|uniref:helix-turn-helix transcriptional regulator n=1 Tax=Clostridium sp. TaxID=1506 RepID=UPI003F66DFCF
MLTILLKNKHCTAKELSEELSLSIRTIYRYVDTLSLSNIPIYTSKGKNGGIFISDDFSYSSFLDNSNIENLLTAIKTLSISANTSSYDLTFKKLKSLLSSKDRHLLNFKINKLFIDTSPSSISSTYINTMNRINEALDNLLEIEFDYYNIYGDKFHCTLEPYRFIFKHSLWLVQGFLIESKTFKVFNIANIYNLTITSKKFNIRYLDYSTIPSLSWKYDTTISVKLLVKESAYELFKKYYNESTLHKLDDSNYEAIISFSNTIAEYSFLFFLGDSIKILSPNHVKNFFIDYTKKILSQYEENH